MTDEEKTYLPLVTEEEDERITRARQYYIEQAKMQQNMPSVKEAFEGDPVPTEHEFRTRNFGLRTKLQAEGIEHSFIEAYDRCVSLTEGKSLALKEIEYLQGVISVHENLNRSLVQRQTITIANYRGLHRAHQRLIGSFWERLKFLFLI